MYVFFIFCMSFIFILIFIISLFLEGVPVVLFFIPLIVIWKIRAFSYFWSRSIMLWISFSALLLLCTIDLGLLCIHYLFIFFCKVFFPLPEFHWTLNSLLNNMLFSSHIFECFLVCLFFIFIFLSWFLVSFHCDKTRLDMIYSLEYVEPYFVFSHVVYVWECPVHLRKMHILRLSLLWFIL